MGKLTISMAIFNSYVKLPESMFFVGSNSDSWTNWNPPHIETVVEACVIGWQTKSSQFKIAWYTFSIWGYLGFDYQLSSSIFLGLGLWLQLDSIWRPWIPDCLGIPHVPMCHDVRWSWGGNLGDPNLNFQTIISEYRRQLILDAAGAGNHERQPRGSAWHRRYAKAWWHPRGGFNHNNWVCYPLVMSK